MAVPPLAKLAGCAGPFLIVAAAVLCIARAGRRPPLARAALLAFCLAAVLAPVGGLPVYGYFWGVIGQPSITTMLLLGGVVVARLSNRRPLPSADVKWLLGCVAAAGFVLYPTGLGLTSVDAYRFGYRPLALLVILPALAVTGWASGKRAAALFPVVAVAAFDLRLLESENLWDYLTDPVVTLFAWGWVICSIVRRCRCVPPAVQRLV